MLGDIYLRQRNYSEAIAALQQARELAPDYLYTFGRLGHAYARINRPADAQQIIQKLLEIQNTGRDASLHLAFIYHALGSEAEALTWFERAVENRQLAEDLFIHPSFQDLRSHPRAQALLRRMNLIP